MSGLLTKFTGAFRKWARVRPAAKRSRRAALALALLEDRMTPAFLGWGSSMYQYGFDSPHSVPVADPNDVIGPNHQSPAQTGSTRTINNLVMFDSSDFHHQTPV